MEVMTVKMLIKKLQKYKGDYEVQVGTSCIFPLRFNPRRIRSTAGGDGDDINKVKDDRWVVAITAV